MPVRPAALTARTVASLKPGDEVADGLSPGLRVRIPSTGERVWSLMMNDASGRRRRFTLAAGLGLKEAREAAQALRLKVREGYDPVAERRATQDRVRAVAGGIGTVRSVMTSYYATGPGAGFKSRDEHGRRIGHVFASLMDRSALDLKRIDLQLVADAHPSASSAAAAVSALRPILRWGTRRGLFTDHGWRDLERPVATARKEGAQEPGRHLNADELRVLWPAFLTDTTGYGTLCQLAFYTAARRREVAQAHWSEINLDAGTWTLPGIRRKDARAKRKVQAEAASDHAVPLPRQALALLRQLYEARLDRTGVVKPDDLVLTGPEMGELANSHRWLRGLDETLIAAHGKTVAPWSLHALRRSCATMAGECGVDPHVIQALLGHKAIGGQLLAKYQRSRYRPEHAAALQMVADLVDGLVSGVDNIVAFNAAVARPA